MTLVNRLTDHLTMRRHDEQVTLRFVRVWMLISLIKVITLWSVSDVYFAHFDFPVTESLPGKLLLLPAMLAASNLNVYFAVTALAITVLLFMRPTYIGNVVFFWLVLNVIRLKFPIANGSDFLAVVFAAYCIPLSTRPVPASPYLRITSVWLFNMFRILAQVQVLIIYFVSGWDKLIHPIWWTGEAFGFIAQLDVMLNPSFTGLLQDSRAQWILSWLAILFELLFGVLVYVKRTRIYILGIGIVFHLVIWVMLSLPDFAIAMIATYLLFLKDSDLETVKQLFKRSPL